MKIAIPACEPNLDGEISPRFGKCSYLIIVDPETMEFEALDNLTALASADAGVSAAHIITDNGVEVVLSHDCEPEAFKVLLAAGIRIFPTVSTTVRSAIDVFKSMQPSLCY